MLKRLKTREQRKGFVAFCMGIFFVVLAPFLYSTNHGGRDILRHHGFCFDDAECILFFIGEVLTICGFMGIFSMFSKVKSWVNAGK